MSVVNMVMDTTGTSLALVAALAVIAVPVLVVIAVVAHRAMRKTTLGQWASSRTEARMDRVRAAWSARKGTKAGAQ